VIETEIYDWRSRGFFFLFFLVSRELMLYFFVGEVSWLEYGELQICPVKNDWNACREREIMSI
jgi:hypothetical protein